MFEVTERHLERAARNLTANPHCRVVRGLNWNHICQARLEIVEGKPKIIDACGEPCSFTCDTAREFARRILLIQSVLRALNETEG